MKKFAILMANGCEEVEALTVVDIFRRAGETIDILAVEDIDIVSSHNVKIRGDLLLSQADPEDYDLVVLPGGLPGAETLRDNPTVQKWLKHFDENDKHIGAICAAPIALAAVGLIEDRKGTAYPGFAEDKYGTYLEDNVVVDGKLITARGPALAMPFALELLRQVVGEDKMKEVADGLLWPQLTGKA